ncbi:MAG: transporter [Phycisphaerales bacterium]
MNTIDSNSGIANVVALVLVVGALFAEANLLRVFLVDWRRGRRKVAKRIAHKSSPRLLASAVACGLAGHGACAVEPAQVEQPTTSQNQTLAESTAEVKPLVISTDRPSFCDTTGIVPNGHFQLETGYTFTLNNHSGVNTQTQNAPEILARYTLIDDRLELRLSTSGYVWSRTTADGSTTKVDGFSDVLPGLKLKLTDQDGALPRLVLEAAATTSIGSDGISNQDIEPTFKLLWSYDLGKGLGVYGNFNVAYATTSGERFVQGQGGVCVTYALNDKLSFYGEYFLFGPNAKGTNSAQYLDFGAAYLLTNRVQLDVRAGVGLNRQSNNFFAGAGVSFLF